MLRKHVLGSFNLNNSKYLGFPLKMFLLGILDTYTKKNEHMCTLAGSGGGRGEGGGCTR